MNSMNWHLVVSLATVSVILVAILIRGITSFGRLSFCTCTLPVCVLITILIRCVSLEGAAEGVRMFVQPETHKLHDYYVWKDAAVQVFFSFVITSGVSITLASYNKFKYPIIRYTILIGLVNVFTSILIGLTMFSMLGIISASVKKPLFDLFKSGLTVPQVLATLPFSPLWSIPYFMALFTSGLHSLLTHIQVILSCMFDSLRNHGNNPNKPLIVITTIFIMFLLGIPLCTDAGIYGIELIDHYVSISFLMIALVEILIISYAYGIGNLFQDLRRMCFWAPPTLCKSHLIVFISSVCPMIIGGLLYICSIDILYPFKSSILNSYLYPSWSVYIGLVIVGTPLACIPLAALHYLVFQQVTTGQYHNGGKPFKATKKMASLSFIDKIKHCFHPTFAYRTNELRCSQRCKRLHNQLQTTMMAGNTGESAANSRPALHVIPKFCCPMAATPNVCVPTSMNSCSVNPYASMCSCPMSTPATIPDTNYQLDRVQCDCTHFGGEYNQSFVQEF